MTDWFARPVLHVTDVEASLHFYVNRLGFTSPWRYDEDGRARVAQVDRQGCALILADTWPEKIGKGLMFISLNVEPETREAAVTALDALRAELEAKGVPVKEGSWGYRLLVVDDPDGNQVKDQQELLSPPLLKTTPNSGTSSAIQISAVCQSRYGASWRQK